MGLHELVQRPVRLRLGGVIDDATEKLALRAALAAAHLFGSATGILLRRLSVMNDPLAKALARAKEAEFKATVFARAAELIGARFDKLPDRKRAFYTPRQRFQILEIKNLLGWTADQTATLVRVCAHTILNWEKHADPKGKTVGTTVRQAPPITRFADAVRNTLHLMAGFGFGDDKTAALVLTRAGWRVSARSVTRIDKEKPRPRPTTPPRGAGPKTTHPVIARFVGHVWMMDITLVQAFLKGQYAEFHVAAVFDAFSRVPSCSRPSRRSQAPRPWPVFSRRLLGNSKELSTSSRIRVGSSRAGSSKRRRRALASFSASVQKAESSLPRGSNASGEP